MPYTAYVILERALPEIDGFKPSQRRILYTMYKMGLLKGSRKKSQGIVGSTMFLHPHGDGAIYETMVRMARDSEALLIPWIDSKGNFGKQYSRDMAYASARYTEARLQPIAKELFVDINKNTVDMVDNFDGEMKEPRLLPVTFPTILINPQSGIANGMASSIAPFNLSEVIEYTIAYIKNSKAEVSDYIKAPDFPTGGNIIYNKAKMDEMLRTGRGSTDIRATYRFEKNTIIFDELPYTTTFEAIIDKITGQIKEGKIKDIVDINDIYGLKTKGIEIIVKNNTNKELLVERLFKTTPLQSSYSSNFNLVVNGRPKVLGVKEIIHEWVVFRADAIKRGAKFDMDKMEHKKRMLETLKKIILDVDKAIAIIRETKKNSEVVANLMELFDINEEQAEYIAEIKLRHLNKEYLIQRIAEIEVLEKEIAKLDDLINNKVTLAKLIISQLKNIQKIYGEDRKSNLIEATEITTIKTEAVEVDDYNVKIFITKEGYLKKIPLTSLRGNFTIKTKEGDSIINEIETTNNSEILIFTDKKNVYKCKAYELEDHKPSVLGEYLPTMLELKDEKILFTTVTDNFKGYLIIGFEDSKVAKIDLSAYETKQNRSMLKNAYADKKALFFKHIEEDVEVLAISSIDKVIVFNTSMINAKSSKATIGVQVLKSKNDSYVKSYHDVDIVEEPEVEYYRIAGVGVGKYLRKGDFPSKF